MGKQSLSFSAMNLVLLFVIIGLILAVFDLENIAFVFELSVLVMFMLLLVFGMFAVYNDRQWGWNVIGAVLAFILVDMFFIYSATKSFGAAHLVAVLFSIIGLIMVLLNLQGMGEERIIETPDKNEGYTPVISNLEASAEEKHEMKEEVQKIVKEESKEELKEEMKVERKFTPGKLVASKKANKFHVPKCDWAKRIKKSNRIWFNSKEEAVSKGFEADTCVP